MPQGIPFSKADPEGAVKISCAVTARVRRGDSAFVHIEDVQDMVQEELMRHGYFKVAENYILYRANRKGLRDETTPEVSGPGAIEQESLIVVRKKDGQSVFWDGSELKRRIQFAMIGLDLCFDEARIEWELRRSIGAEITEEGSAARSCSTRVRSSKRTRTSRSSPRAFSSRTSTRKCSTGTSPATASRGSRKRTKRRSRVTCATAWPSSA